MEGLQGTYQNEVKVVFASNSCNESFARMVVSAFATGLDPTLEELADLKTAVSEAVTNAIIHGYAGTSGEIRMGLWQQGQSIFVEIEDYGVGIADVNKAREPMYTTSTDGERSGMGFSFMEAFTDSLEVESQPGKGTLVRMKKTISA